MKSLLITFLLISLSSCDDSFEIEELYGYYTPLDYKNTFDTIYLAVNGIYERKVYDKNKKLLLSTTGRWEFENNHRLRFDGFYFNLDDDLVKYPYKVKDSDMSINTYFERVGYGNIRFCVGYYPGENCYQKIIQ